MTKKDLYQIGGVLSGIIVLIGVWIYALSEWGFLIGIMIGWIPALISGIIAYFIWPVLVLILLWIFWTLSSDFKSEINGVLIIITFLVVSALVLQWIDQEYKKTTDKYPKINLYLKSLSRLIQATIVVSVFYIIPLALISFILFGGSTADEKFAIVGMLAILPIGWTIFEIFRRRKNRH